MTLNAILCLALFTFTLLVSASSTAREGLGKVNLKCYEPTLDLPSRPGLSAVSEGHSDQVKGNWRGKLGRSEVHMTLFLFLYGRTLPAGPVGARAGTIETLCWGAPSPL